MKNPMSKLKIALASGALALCLLPAVGWSARLYGVEVSGQVTALPGGDEIEVGSRTYHIRQGSPAEKVLSRISTGQQVHLILDKALSDPKSEVIGITVDSASGE
jgi:hypothetical protein